MISLISMLDNSFESRKRKQCDQLGCEFRRAMLIYCNDDGTDSEALFLSRRSRNPRAECIDEEYTGSVEKIHLPRFLSVPLANSLMKLKKWCQLHSKRSSFINQVPDAIYDFLDKCLTANPRLRISAEEALQHEFLTPCHDILKQQTTPSLPTI